MRRVVLLAVLTVIPGVAALPAAAQDDKVKPAIETPETGQGKVKPAVQEGGAPKDDAVKPAIPQIQEEPSVRPQPAPAPAPAPRALNGNGVRGRQGQYVPAYQSPTGGFVDPYSGYAYDSGATYGNYGGYAGGWCGPSAAPVTGYFPGTTYGDPSNDSRAQYWRDNPPRVRVGAYDNRTLSRFGLPADPVDAGQYTAAPRMRVTPYATQPGNVIRSVLWR